MQESYSESEYRKTMIEINRYARRPFFVDAAQVTEENMQELADWCSGHIITTNTDKYIKVKVKRPTNPRQTTAMVGDWILVSEYGYKVFSQRNFELKFSKVG